MKIIQDDLDGPEVAALLQEHVQDMHDISPQDSIHTLSIGALRSPDITVWTAWRSDEILGCGALKELSKDAGEIKSMRTANAHRGKGVGARILRHIIDIAAARGYDQIYLETGSVPAFRPAHALYEKAGFTYCGPFANYEDGPFSRFMVLKL